MNVAAIFNLYRSIVPPVYANSQIAQIMRRAERDHRAANPMSGSDKDEKIQHAREATARATRLAGLAP